MLSLNIRFCFPRLPLFDWAWYNSCTTLCETDTLILDYRRPAWQRCWAFNYLKERLSMNIVSWNLNGLMSSIKNGSLDVLEEKVPDVICLQEIRTKQEPVIIGGYHHYWNHGERDTVRAAITPYPKPTKKRRKTKHNQQCLTRSSWLWRCRA